MIEHSERQPSYIQPIGRKIRELMFSNPTDGK